MRRKYFGWAIAAIATLGPMQAWGGDREIAEQIIERLKADRDAGTLKDFTLDMKVDQGVVLFRGHVSQSSQKELLLRAADGIDGVTKVVDEVGVNSAKAADRGAASDQASNRSGFSFRDALAAQAEAIRGEAPPMSVQVQNASEVLATVPGEVMPTAGSEPLEGPANGTNGVNGASSNREVASAVIGALRDAQLRGELRGFGVDVRNQGGTIELVGQAGSESQRERIVQIAENTPGVRGVRDDIRVAQVNAEVPAPADDPPRLPEAPELAPLTPVTVANAPVRPTAAMRSPRSGGSVSAAAAPYRMQGQPTARPVAAPMPGGGMQGRGMTGVAMQGGGMQGGGMQGAPVMGQPVPMGGYGGAGAPRYDSPYLPNYAWPGYAAYPNYSAVSYPQQYSPSAFPYIGPFYPYPQVPLGWRKVSLEWDDGWWFLDFSDR